MQSPIESHPMILQGSRTSIQTAQHAAFGPVLHWKLVEISWSFQVSERIEVHEFLYNLQHPSTKQKSKIGTVIGKEIIRMVWNGVNILSFHCVPAQNDIFLLGGTRPWVAKKTVETCFHTFQDFTLKNQDIDPVSAATVKQIIFNVLLWPKFVAQEDLVVNFKDYWMKLLDPPV